MPVAPCEAYRGQFVSNFIAELKRRGCPKFPERAWKDALACADLTQRTLGPGKELGRALSVCQERAGERRLVTDKYLMTSVSRACDRWWAKYGGDPEPSVWQRRSA